MWSMWLVDWNWSQGRNVSLQLSAAVEFISYALQVRWEKSYYALVYRVEPFPPQTGDRAVDGKSVFFVVLSRASLRLWSDHGLQFCSHPSTHLWIQNTIGDFISALFPFGRIGQIGDRIQSRNVLQVAMICVVVFNGTNWTPDGECLVPFPQGCHGLTGDTKGHLAFRFDDGGGGR